ncbi:hypothetical protein [Flavobacterium cerinum]|uniref:Cell wall anchor protein n=1 Tax=Flavobacterium cerinum TaxID=2502784 RepID=A0A3S3QM10_9FLAO|nr:hypothetical protein [Flavobacterium cerinum]RWX01666.1 hypothetical protein EPI11_06875 [Flavobacterium cerinum]
MKKQIFTLAIVFYAVCGYSQFGSPTPNVFPATGYVGLGTTTPTHKLEVISDDGSGYLGTYQETIASFSKYPSLGLNIQGIGYEVGSGRFTTIEHTCKIQMLEGIAKSGFIEFGKIRSANTEKSAVSFGYNDVESMRINHNGKVRIGNGVNDIKTPDGYKLFVEEGILTEKVKIAIKTTTEWADYVFEPEYKLMPLEEVEKFTKENNHLPDVPSAKAMVLEGLDVAKMDAKLLQKIEELTLYAIEQNNEAKELKTKLTEQKEEIELLKAQMKSLLQKQ